MKSCIIAKGFVVPAVLQWSRTQKGSLPQWRKLDVAAETASLLPGRVSARFEPAGRAACANGSVSATVRS